MQCRGIVGERHRYWNIKGWGQHSEAKPYETKHVQIYNRTVVRWQQAILLISWSAEVLANHKTKNLRVHGNFGGIDCIVLRQRNVRDDVANPYHANPH